MRCDFGPFMDKRIRKAAALTLDRPGYIKGVLGGAAEVANDSVMDSFKATVDPTVAQRKKDIAAAKKLMAEAGVPNGFKVDLHTWKRDDNDKFAQYVKTAFAEIGIDVTLYIDGSDGGAAVFYTYVPYPAVKGKIEKNNGSWLACNLGVAEWGGRPTPDQYLSREWHSEGDWNASHINSPDLDAAIKEWQGALSLPKKKAASSKIQKVALEETPYIVAYNETRISAISKKIIGLEFNSMGQADLSKARPA
jgi:peptide/nickel transport system substrate-binding protein